VFTVIVAWLPLTAPVPSVFAPPLNVIVPVALPPNCDVSEADQVGSAQVVTDASGVIKEQIEYHPYGEERFITNIVANHYRFTGKEHDNETNDDYFGARYYSSTLSRFLTPDWAATPVPIPYAVISNPQTLNLYSYVENNPITGTDPDGHGNLCTAGQCDDPTTKKDKPHKVSDAQIKAWIAQAKAELEAMKAAATKGEQGIDAFNKYVGFGQSHCSGGSFDDCVNAVGMAGTAVVAAFASGGESEAAAGGRIALDTNALIAAIERPTTAEGQAVLAKIAGKEVSISITAAKEFLAKGSSQELREFLAAHSGHISKAAPDAVVRSLKAAGLKDKDARVVGAAVAEGIKVLTNDYKTIIRKVPGLAEPI
jgi:RHS repeat-associated protein